MRSVPACPQASRRVTDQLTTAFAIMGTAASMLAMLVFAFSIVALPAPAHAQSADYSPGCGGPMWPEGSGSCGGAGGDADLGAACASWNPVYGPGMVITAYGQNWATCAGQLTPGGYA